MSNFLGRIDELVRNLFGGSVDYARDAATWEAANTVERATFGKVFNVIEGVIGLIVLFGCMFIINATQNQSFLMVVCGILWVIPFIAVGGLLARFRRSLFVRIRGTMSRFLGG